MVRGDPMISVIRCRQQADADCMISLEEDNSELTNHVSKVLTGRKKADHKSNGKTQSVCYRQDFSIFDT